SSLRENRCGLAVTLVLGVLFAAWAPTCAVDRGEPCGHAATLGAVSSALCMEAGQPGSWCCGTATTQRSLARSGRAIAGPRHCSCPRGPPPLMPLAVFQAALQDLSPDELAAPSDPRPVDQNLRILCGLSLFPTGPLQTHWLPSSPPRAPPAC